MLSVLLICYNQEDFIAQAIDSILEQKIDFEFEIVIGDDCSTDKTSEIIKSYAVRNHSIKYYRHENNLGLIGNYLFCHRKAKGKYIATLDGDDYWIDDNKLRKQVEMMENNEQMGMVHTQYNNLFMYPKFFGRRYVKNVLSKKLSRLNCTFEGVYSEYSIRSSSVCYRRKIVEESQILEEFEKNTFPVEDWPIHLQCSMGWEVGYLPEATTVYRINRSSLSHFYENEKRIAFIQSLQNVRQYFLKYRTIDPQIEAKWERSNNMSIAHHHYKSGNYSAFKKVFYLMENKPFSIRMMFFVLWLKKYRLLKNEDVLKS